MSCCLCCPWPLVPAAAASTLCWDTKTLFFLWLDTPDCKVCSNSTNTVEGSETLGPPPWSSSCSSRLKASKKALSWTDRWPPKVEDNGLRLAVRSEATLATPPGPVIPGISIEVEVSATTDFVKRGVDPFILLSTWPWTSGHRGCFPNIFEASARRFYTVLVSSSRKGLPSCFFQPHRGRKRLQQLSHICLWRSLQSIHSNVGRPRLWANERLREWEWLTQLQISLSPLFYLVIRNFLLRFVFSLNWIGTLSLQDWGTEWR